MQFQFNYYDSTSEDSDSDDEEDERYDNRPMTQREAVSGPMSIDSLAPLLPFHHQGAPKRILTKSNFQNKVDKLYDGNCEYIRAKREFEREMREIKERQQKKKAAESAPVYNNVETLKREQRMFAGLSKF